MSEDLKELLSSNDKGVEQSKGVLARLFRQILADRKVTPMAWDSLMIKYLNDPRNQIPDNGKDRSSARGNLNKELRKPTMTWKVFMKGLRFLRPVHVRFEIHPTWRNGKTTVHGVNLNMNLGAEEDDEPGGDDDE